MNEKTLYWLPRILIIILICLMGVLSIDVFSMEGSFLEKIGGFFIHNIPVFILILLLVFTWKKEKTGGIIFIALGAMFIFFFRAYQRIDTFLLISFPPMLAGFLFLLHDRQMKKTLVNNAHFGLTPDFLILSIITAVILLIGSYLFSKIQT